MEDSKITMDMTGNNKCQVCSVRLENKQTKLVIPLPFYSITEQANKQIQSIISMLILFHFPEGNLVFGLEISSEEKGPFLFSKIY